MYRIGFHQHRKFQLDQHASIESFIEKTNNELDGIDILVNNAGITLDNLSIRLTEDNWKKVIGKKLNRNLLEDHILKWRDFE